MIFSIPKSLGRRRHLLALLTAAAVYLSCALPLLAADEFKEEIEMGKEGAAAVAKEHKFVTDEKLAKRIQDIGSKLAKVAVEQEVPAAYGKSKVAPFQYNFTIIDDKTINAFSLPGGHIYVNSALLDYTHSDDELAGVLAHEIAHASHHHVLQLAKEQQKQMLTLAIAVIAGAALGGNAVGELAYGANLVTIAKMSAYGQEAEKDADLTAVEYMVRSGYNPVGMLTFMERLARDESRRPSVDWGIFRTHPESYKRASLITQQIEKHGIKVNRRLVTGFLKVTVAADDENDPKWYEVKVADVPIIRLADSDGKKAKARAQEAARKLGECFLDGAQMRDIKMGLTGQYVKIKNEIVIEPTQADADLAATTVQAVAGDAAKALRTVLWQEQLDSSF